MVHCNTVQRLMGTGRPEDIYLGGLGVAQAEM
jgi:hypothetical protein